MVSLSAALSVFMAGAVWAQQANQAQDRNQTSNNQLTQQEKTFLNEAAINNMAEIQSGNMAQQKGQNSQVQDYGRMLVTDHQQNQDRLQALASRFNITLPTSVDSQHQQQMSQMQALNGQQFDRKFAAQEIMDHQKAIQQFQRMANSATDPDVKQYASETVPVLQQHLQRARQFQSMPSNSSSSNVNSSSTTTTQQSSTSTDNTTADAQKTQSDNGSSQALPRTASNQSVLLGLALFCFMIAGARRLLRRQSVRR